MVKEGLFHHIDHKDGPRVEKYGVDLRDLEKVGINTLRNALRKPEAKIIAIDEIGKMELFHPEFLEILDRIIASDKMVLATISYKMTELLTKFKNRRYTCVFNLENVPKDSMEREELKEKIVEIILKNYIPQK